MSTWIRHFPMASLVAAMSACPRATADSPSPRTEAVADVVFKNANVYTNYELRPRAHALAIRGGRIVYVGTAEGVRPYEARARVIDVRGKTVVPGFTDAHVHLSEIGKSEGGLGLEGIESLDALLSTVRAAVAKKKPGEWVTGDGWIETFWTPPVFPTRADLDKVAPANPVLLRRRDGHAAIANSAALRLAHVDRLTKEPFGGEIAKDRHTGLPTGMLLDRAQDLVERYVPPETPEETERNLLLGVRREVSLGWTEIQIAGNSWDEIDVIRKLYRKGQIALRIYDAVNGPGPDSKRLLEQGPAVGEFGGRFTVRAIKIHYDGALGSRGAALLEPYADAPSTSGMLTEADDDVSRLLEAALRRGLQVETHAIGDRANRSILNLYEKAFASVPPQQRKTTEPRFRIEHAQIVDPADLPRFAKLGVIPSIQPSHAIDDLHFAGKRLGMARLERAYLWRSFISSGSIIAGGSDAPVERGEPMIEFYAAITRKDLKGQSGLGWHPEQVLSRGETLKALTLWPAYAAFEENDRGSIEPGKLADFTVLSADLMQIPESEIPNVRCLATVVNGEVVYRSADF